MKEKESKNISYVFVADEQSDDFVAHIERRVAKAKRGEAVISRETFIEKLNDRIGLMKIWRLV